MLLLSAAHTNELAKAQAQFEAAGSFCRLLAEKGCDADYLCTQPSRHWGASALLRVEYRSIRNAAGLRFNTVHKPTWWILRRCKEKRVAIIHNMEQRLAIRMPDYAWALRCLPKIVTSR